MRRLMSTALCAALMLCTLSTQAQFWTEDFETDGEGTRYTSATAFYGGTSDQFVRTDGTAPVTIAIAEGGFYTGLEGSWVWAGEDLDDAAGDGNAFKSLTFSGIDITGVGNIEFRALFGANGSGAFPGWDASDELYIEYQVDGGGYTKLMEFIADAPTNGYLQHDSNLDGTPDGVLLSAAMQEFNAFISGLSGTSLDLRVYVSANSAGEEFAFDHFRMFDIGAAGCTDNTACNYDAAAGVDDGSCFYPGDSCDDADATTVNDVVQGDCSCAGIVPNLVITEIMYNPNDAGGFPDNDYEYLEIYNAGADAVTIDNFTFTGFTATIPANSTIAAGEYVVFALNDATYTGMGYQVFDIAGGLSNGGETLEIIDDNGNVIDAVTYNDVSPWPTAADGDGPALALTNPSDDNSLAANWYAYCVGGGDLSGSPGAANPGPLSGCTDPTALNYEVCASTDDGSCTFLMGVSDIVINELHYNPCTTQGTDDTFEFIELFNTTAGTIDIGDWYLANGINFTFPTGTMMAAGEYIIVCADATSYSGLGLQTFEWGIGQGLVNTGESVNLFDDTAQLIDLVAYGTMAPWPTDPNGNCNSLELIDSFGENNDPTAWQASYTFGGTPGTPNSVSGGYECTDCGGGSTTETTFSEDFESGLFAWSGSTFNYITSTSDAITTTSLASNAAGAGTSSLYTEVGCLDITGVCTTWNVDLKQAAGWTADGTNAITYLLGADAANVATANGYAVTMSSAFGAGNISLVRLDGGVGTALIGGPVALPDDQATSIEVRHLEDGTWVLLIDIDGGADSFLAVNTTVVDDTYTAFTHTGVSLDHDATYGSGLRVDNITINQCAVVETVYSVASGASSGAIWNTDPMGAGTSINLNRFKDVEIQAATAVSLDQDEAVGSITIAGTLDPASQQLTAYGDWTNNGTFTTGGTVRFKGGSAANVGGSAVTEFDAVVLEKDAGVTVSLTAEAGLNGLMAMESGTFDTNGQTFTLRAVVDGRGSIGEIKSDAAWVGDVTFETYIPVTLQNDYFNLGNPVTGNNLGAWNDDIETTGFFGSDYPDWPTPVAPYVNIYHYNETAAGDLNDNGWIPASNILNPLYTNNGYMLYLNAGEYTIDATGGIQVGPVNDPVTHTVSTGLADDGWNLVTNPLPCSVVWTDVYNASSGIQPQYYVMDTDGANGYVFYDAVSATGTGAPVIAAGSSLWVKADVGGGTLTWNESAKATTFQAYERADFSAPLIALELDGDDHSDFTYLVFDNEAAAAADHLDGFKLYSAQPGLALTSEDGFDLAVNYIPAELESITIPVHLRVGAAFEGTVRVDELYEVPEGYCMTLTDLETGAAMEIVEGAELAFATEDAVDATRFELTLSRVVEASATDAFCYNGASGTATATSPTEVTFTWTDEMDMVIATETGTESTLEGLLMGNYTVSAQAADGLCAAVATTVWVDQPSQEVLEATGYIAGCNVWDGYIEVDVQGADAFAAALNLDGTTVASGNFTGLIEFDGLDAETYDLVVTTGCSTFEQSFDLTDPNAIDLELTSEAAIISFDGTPQTVEVFANQSGATEVLWWVNEVPMGSGASLLVQVDALGTYEVTAMAYGESCAASDYLLIQVEQATDIQEEAAADIQLVVLADQLQLTPSTELQGQGQLRVFGANGQLIATERMPASGTFTLSTAGWATGAYTVVIDTENLHWTAPFVKR